MIITHLAIMTVHDYSQSEERLNILTHAIGIPIGAIALIFMLLKADDGLEKVSVSVFGISMIVLYASSTFYHASKLPKLRRKFRVLDHAAIFVLIAGTYTPLSLITLSGDIGQIIFYTVWAIALAGIVLKLFFTGRFNILSTILYVLMGWLVIFAISPLIQEMSNGGLFWLFMGGASYTLGAILYSIDRLPYNHAIFHVFVLGGSICHIIATYFYVLS